MSRIAWTLGWSLYWMLGRYWNPFRVGTRPASAFYGGYASWCPAFRQRYRDWVEGEEEAREMEARFRFQ